ncbi:MAG: hypothetical protein ACPHGV_03175 [Synechococcus sp.]
MIRSQLLSLVCLLAPLVSAPAALAHGSHGGGNNEALAAGDFDFTPVISLEGHGGFETNLDGAPKHVAIDGLFGGVFSWGLGHGANVSIEAAIGPALVWGEAEHFYGKVHVDDHAEESDDTHGHEIDDVHDDHDDHADHADHDDHDVHDDHDEHADHAHGHDSDFKRVDLKGYLQVRYAPNDRLNLALSWMPYWVTKDQGDDLEGLKNELSAKLTWGLGDGDVNFGLGDGLTDLVDGVYVSVDHRQGWESDGVWMGNYTDPRVGLGFKVGADEVNIKLEAGPRFYTPGHYSGLNQRTDFAGEVEVSVPVGDALLFAHWQPVYTPEDAPGWGEGWQHHVGTGVSFSF